MPTEIHGLPAHVLLVHAVVVLVPLAALLLVLSAIWPAARRRLGWFSPLVALVALVSVPITTHAGEWLRDHVRDTVLVDRHAELGDQLLPFMIGVFLCAVAIWRLERDRPLSIGSRSQGVRPARWIVPARRVVAVVALVVSVFTVVQVYRIGDSGARAAWQGRFSTPAHHGGSSEGG